MKKKSASRSSSRRSDVMSNEVPKSVRIDLSQEPNSRPAGSQEPDSGQLESQDAADEEDLPSPESIKADSDFVTDRLSTQARGLAFGTLAIIWASLAGKSDSIHLERELALPVTMIAIGTIFVDFLQYVVGYALIQRFDRYYRTNQDVSMYEDWALYKWRTWFFIAKLVLAGATTIGLLYIVWIAIQ